MTSKRLEVTVDQDICVGNAMCRAIAPAVFEETASGQSEARDSSGASEHEILEAASCCPVGAISVKDAETGEDVQF
jgi:ferredoxin